MNDRSKSPLRELDSEVLKALDKCTEALSLNELSRITGVRIELLRRYVNRRAAVVRSETWDKIYPVLKPYLEGPVPPQEPPPRIGPAYRRHPDLVAMTSAQKVLLDEFVIFSDSDRKKIVAEFAAECGNGVKPSAYESLSSQENALMGAFEAMPAEKQEAKLAELTDRATAEVRRRRRELF